MRNVKSVLALMLGASLLLAGCKDDKDGDADYNPVSGKKGVLLVTFGSSYGYYDGEDTSPFKYQKPKDTFDNVLKQFKETFPNEEVRMAYTSGIIMNKLRKDGKANLDFPNEALKNMAKEGFEEITVQSLHIIPGAEYNEMMGLVNDFKKSYPKVNIKVGLPLLYSNTDIQKVADIIVNQYKAVLDRNEAVVFMGHGNEKFLAYNAYYKQLQEAVSKKYPTYKLYIGTVEGEPGIEDIVKQLSSQTIAGKKVTIAPLMSIAGDHANNDMASSEPDSWKSTLEKAGYTVVPELVGLGAYKEIVNIWVAHKKESK